MGSAIHAREYQRTCAAFPGYLAVARQRWTVGADQEVEQERRCAKAMIEAQCCRLQSSHMAVSY